MKIMYKLLPIIHMLSKLSLLFSLLTFVPTTISHLFGDHAFMAFAETTFITVLVSLVVWLATYQYQRELRPRYVELVGGNGDYCVGGGGVADAGRGGDATAESRNSRY